MDIEPVAGTKRPWYRHVRFILPLVGVGIGAGLLLRILATFDDVLGQFGEGSLLRIMRARALGSVVLLGATLYGLGLVMDRRPAKKWTEYMWGALAIAIVMAVWAVLTYVAVFAWHPFSVMGTLE